MGDSIEFSHSFRFRSVPPPCKGAPPPSDLHNTGLENKAAKIMQWRTREIMASAMRKTHKLCVFRIALAIISLVINPQPLKTAGYASYVLCKSRLRLMYLATYFVPYKSLKRSVNAITNWLRFFGAVFKPLSFLTIFFPCALLLYTPFMAIKYLVFIFILSFDNGKVQSLGNSMCIIDVLYEDIKHIVFIQRYHIPLCQNFEDHSTMLLWILSRFQRYFLHTITKF